MKINYSILFLICVLIFSCDNDNSDLEVVMVATPEFMSKTEFRKSVDIISARAIEDPGKIYVYDNYIFVNDMDGIHIIDNSNPKFPKKVKFISIPGNEDISVKNNYLFADSATDLLVFDISNINMITEVERLEDVFSIYNIQIPIEAQAVDYNNYNYKEDIIVGWTLKREFRKKQDNFVIDIAFDGVATTVSNAESKTGTGGSLARFQIVDNYLYTVGNYEMAIFNIQNLAEPTLANTQYAGWNIETMFQADDYLYLGSTNGMYIYSLSNPSFPEFVSEFTHWEGCDPVVVDGDYAYLTLRGGNLCGQLESVLEVIDISDKTNPVLAARHELENPYGLGIKENMLFVCDGTAGLKLFNKTNPLDIKQLRTINNIQSKDVIPLENSLLMIGGDVLYQYEYLEDNVKLISSFSLN